MQIEIELADHRVTCDVESLDAEAGTYRGTLPETINDADTAQFWDDYECAVNDVLLVEVDRLESELVHRPFFVIVRGERFHASDVDLQIFPSSGGFSLTVPPRVRKC